MIARDTDQLFQALSEILAGARGPDRAITLQQLADRAVASRRDVELCIESCLARFPFVLVAGGDGYYIPTNADDINRYLHSLHSRHRRMQIREATVRRKARAHGWPEEAAGRFVNPPHAAQQELFR